MRHLSIFANYPKYAEVTYVTELYAAVAYYCSANFTYAERFVSIAY